MTTSIIAIRRRVSIIGMSLLTMLAATTTMACGSADAPVSTARPPRSLAPVTSVVPQRDDLGMTPGSPILVGTRDLSETGYVKWDDAFPPPGHPAATVVPVWTKDLRHQIGYWAIGLGWLSLDHVNSPDFNYQNELGARQRAADAIRATSGN